MAAGRIFGCSSLIALSLLLRVVYFGQNTTKLSANHLSSPTKVFYYAYDGNPDGFPLQKFDHAACDVRHLGSCFHPPSCRRSYRGKFGKSTLIALSHYALIANPIIPKNPKIFVPHQFSVKFMPKKADKLQKILVLHPKIRNQR